MAAVMATTRGSCFGQVDHGIGKRGRPGFAGALVDLDPAALHAERGGAVELGRLADSEFVPLPLTVFTCSRTGALHVLDLGQRVDQARQIVAVDRAEVFDAQASRTSAPATWRA